MKAAVVTDFAAPLEIQERGIPAPGSGQVLVRMESCGLCHTGIHAAHGDWPIKPSPPSETVAVFGVDDVLSGAALARPVFEF